MKYIHPKSWAVLCNDPAYFCKNVRLGHTDAVRFDHGEMVELNAKLPNDGKFYYRDANGFYMNAQKA